MYMGVGRIFSRGSQKWIFPGDSPKDSFQGVQQWWNFILPTFQSMPICISDRL